MFDSYPSFDRYRTLRLTEPLMSGEDVFALQTALLANGFDPKGLDGILGKNTVTAINVAQLKFGLVVDGLAGGKTQEALARKIADNAQASYHLAKGLIRGQLEHESSWRLGNYSAIYEDGTFDAGVSQMNTAHYGPRVAFDTPMAIDMLAKNIRKYYDLFTPVTDNRRRWSLAAGSWNRPAYACYLAGVKPNAKPSAASAVLLEAYMTSVTAYLNV